MNKRAKKYSKLIVFKDPRMQKLVDNAAETRSTDKKKSIDRHYPYNCISKYFPLAHTFPREIHMKYQLPCGFLYGESWGALRKCWLGYKTAKRAEDEPLMREYATRIQKIQKELGIPTASFPNLGLLGDIFFLYDKEKEAELRQQYMYENVVCDKFGVNSIEQLVEEGKAEIFNSTLEYKRYQEKKFYDAFNDVFNSWSNSESTQEYLKASQIRWNYRQKVKNELHEIKDELASFKREDSHWLRRLKGEERKKTLERRQYLIHQKILKESEISSINATQIVKTDSGYKYAKEIIKNDYRRVKLYNYTPQYYLTDLKGHRLADYKEENDLGVINDPLLYRLYLEDKEWEKIHSQQQYY